jgi:hypothetical protein
VSACLGKREEARIWIGKLVAKFRSKSATSPEKAVTAEELGLGPRFKDAVQRRLGKSGIFVEVNGKYYLSENRLKEIQERNRDQGP